MKKIILLLALFTAGSAIAYVLPWNVEEGQINSNDSNYSDVVHLDQGWTAEDRQRYYYTSQGSAAMYYDIFLNLESANSDQLFRADENVVRYGLVPQQPEAKYNPDGLPIGITKTYVIDGRWKGEWVGLGCAACHNGLIEYEGKKISISGGNSSRIDVFGLIKGLDEALWKTIEDPNKFARLAQKLGKNDKNSQQALLERLQENADTIHNYQSVLGLTPTVVGPGRMDALSLIHNQVQSRWLGIPENWVSPLAPVKPSFCWNIPQSAWAQWSGVLNNPLLRNQGEVLGVFARMDIVSKTPAEGLFESTVDLQGLITSEGLLRRLAPPQWPEKILGKIDLQKAQAGAKLFAANCASCHSSWPHRWSEPKLEGKRFIENAIVPVSYVGTDPLQFTRPQFQSLPLMKSGPLSKHLPSPYTDAAIVAPPVTFGVILRGIFDTAIAKLGLSKEELLSANGYQITYPDQVDSPPSLSSYKANPIEGMWTSAPYLHNGSVPNLYELLSPARERTQKFYLGRDFDPIKVGVDTSGKSGKFLFDTSLVGNSNSGHSFENGPLGNGVIGRLLTEDERWALIEFIKSVPNEPEQISPYGGLEDSARAWKDPTFFNVKNPGTYNGAPKLIDASRESLESIEPSEKNLIDLINKSTVERLRSQFPEGVKPVLRDAHPKTHGIVRAEFIVLDDLPEEYRHGVFKAPRKFDAIIRFSAGGIQVEPDTKPQAAGVAIKLLGVEGKKLLAGEKDASTQDFVMINFPGFFVKNLEDYELLHQAMDGGRLEDFFKGRPEETQAIIGMRSQNMTNPLQARYFSQTPYLLGDRAIKFSIKPVTQYENVKNVGTGPDFLRENMKKQLTEGDVYFEFLVQLQSDPVTMPVENSLAIWDETVSPFKQVALIRIPKQDISGTQKFAETLSFTPWHSLPEHRPLGSINRARREIYENLSKFRHERNNLPREEPKEIPF